jgi:hypothetical protein
MNISLLSIAEFICPARLAPVQLQQAESDH